MLGRPKDRLYVIQTYSLKHIYLFVMDGIELITDPI